jgi:hypothetical protein
MTLNQWRENKGLTWHKLSILLGKQGFGHVYDNRLNRLRRGAKPTMDERHALINMTLGEVDCYKDAD